jgi:LysM repeat protein
MKKFLYTVILLVMISSLFLVGCTKSATKGGVEAGPTTTSSIPFPVGPTTNPNRMTEIVSATQTAVVSNPKGEATNTETSGEVSTIPQIPEATQVPTAEPTAKPVVVIPTATPGKPSTYTLQKGEFPYCIARRFDVNPGQLLSINNITANENVSPGVTLTIPTNSSWPSEYERSLKDHPATYTVQSGQTIYEIACLFGDVDPNEIILANALESPYTLSAGQVLDIP